MRCLITALGLCCLLLGVSATDKDDKGKSRERCGCSDISPYDSEYLSPWRYYKYPDFPFLCRIMQGTNFRSVCTILNDFWVAGCSILFEDEKDIQIVVDRSLVDKRKVNAVELVYPFAKQGTCKFVLIRLSRSINFNTTRNNTICPICLPEPGFSYYGTGIIPHYINPVGYCCQFSTTCFMARKVNLDCCHRENYGCNDDGRLCSSDMHKDGDNVGCQGLVGAPIIRREGNRFYLVAIMCDLLGCEGNQPCSYFESIAHLVIFMKRAMNQ